jgi:hypothetical protein
MIWLTTLTNYTCRRLTRRVNWKPLLSHATSLTRRCYSQDIKEAEHVTKEPLTPLAKQLGNEIRVRNLSC